MIRNGSHSFASTFLGDCHINVKCKGLKIFRSTYFSDCHIRLAVFSTSVKKTKRANWLVANYVLTELCDIY